MAKKIVLSINDGYVATFFPENRIKTKFQTLIILMETVRYGINSPVTQIIGKDIENKIILNIDKMSRVFYICKNKAYSIVFPFKITTGTNFIMSYKNVFTFDSHSISVIISTLKILQELSDLTNESCYNFIEPIMNIEDEEVNYWIIIKMLLLMEDGYIRYDIDHAGYKKAFEDEKPHTHPIHHLDVFYSANTTFKLGLKSELSHDGFLDTLDINTDCLYLDCFKTK